MRPVISGRDKSTANPAVLGDVAYGPDGTLYYANNGTGRIMRVLKDGTEVAIAGSGYFGSQADCVVDGLASQAHLRDISALKVAADGSVYFVMDVEGHDCVRVCRLVGDSIHTVAGGNGRAGGGYGDSLQAIDARFLTLTSLALGPDGSVFVGDRDDHRVRRIAPNGIITTYAGNGSAGSSGNNATGPARGIALVGVDDLEVDGDGNLYIAEASNYRIRRVRPDGMLTTYAGGTSDFKPVSIALAPDGGIFVVSRYTDCQSVPNLCSNNRVWRADPDGALSPVAGGGPEGIPLSAGAAIPAAAAWLGFPTHIAVAADGSYHITDRNTLARVYRSFGTVRGDEIGIASEDGGEVFEFDRRSGRHLRTRDALTGAVRYRFEYDAGRLSAIHDANGGVTRIQRSGSSITLTTPYGQVTHLELDGSWLHTVVNPASETYTIAYHDGGLLQSLTDPRGHATTYTFAADGRLETAEDAAGGSQTLLATYSGLTRTVTHETGLGRLTTYSASDSINGSQARSVATPDQGTATSVNRYDGRVTMAGPTAETVIDSVRGDPRFGLLVAVPGVTTERLLPGGSTNRTTRLTRSYSGTYDPLDPQPYTESISINGRPPIVSTFTPSSRTLTVTSSTGKRRVTATVDTVGRPTAVIASGLAPLRLSYDERGRVTGVRQLARAWRYDYDARGRLAAITDTLGRRAAFRYDSAGRVLTDSLPGGRIVQYQYDPNGNLTSLTPPGREAHEFGYTVVDLDSVYRPPALEGEPDPATFYDHSGDRELLTVTEPGGVEVELDYGATTGRLETITQPRGTAGLGYDATSGLLTSLSSPDGVSLALGYDGPLLERQEWSGPFAGSVEHGYDQDFRVASERVNEGLEVSYGYDGDGLLTSAGALEVVRQDSTGLPDSTRLASGAGVVSGRWDYDGYGDLANRHLAWNGGQYLESLTRDGVGRIVARRERLAGTDTTYGYAYDEVGRLYAVTADGDTAARYRYDANGNLTLRTLGASDTTSGTYDGQDRLVRWGATRYGWTPAGRLAWRAEGSDTTRYGYDALGNLLQVTLPGPDTVRYAVDGWAWPDSVDGLTMLPESPALSRRLSGLLCKRPPGNAGSPPPNVIENWFGRDADSECCGRAWVAATLPAMVVPGTHPEDPPCRVSSPSRSSRSRRS